MGDRSRLNGVIRALEGGTPAFTTFTPADVQTAIALSTSQYDGVVFEMEHNPWNPETLRDSLQYLLNRRHIAQSGSVIPAVTPLVRIPANGREKTQWHAKQALDLGVYGIIWPHISTVEEAYNAVAACRYPRLKTAPLYEPAGLRGDQVGTASRYWGLTEKEYYSKADVWPLNPNGEILVVLMIEDIEGIDNLREILSEVPGIGVILIGEGDLSQELGHPREYDHPTVIQQKERIVSICKEFNVPVGRPHVTPQNIEEVLNEGFRFIMAPPVRTYAALEAGLRLIGRP